MLLPYRTLQETKKNEYKQEFHLGHSLGAVHVVHDEHAKDQLGASQMCFESALQEIEPGQGKICSCPIDEDPRHQDKDNPPNHPTTAAPHWITPSNFLRSDEYGRLDVLVCMHARL